MRGRPIQEKTGMGYLFTQFIWYVLIAFLVGLIVGWVTCSRVEDDRA